MPPSCRYFMTPLLTENTALRFYYGGKSIWFFVAGIAIWYLTNAIARWRRQMHVPKWTLPAAIAAYSVSSVIAGMIWPFPDVAFYPAIVLAPMLILVVVLAAQYGSDLKPRILIVLGNASYGCYLLHTILIELLRHRDIAIDGGVLMTAYIILASWVIAVPWYILIERGIAAFVKQRRVRRATTHLSPSI